MPLAEICLEWKNEFYYLNLSTIAKIYYDETEA